MTRLIDVSLMDYESEDCLQLGGGNYKVEGSVFIVMMSRNPEGPQDLSKSLTVLLFISCVHSVVVRSVALPFLEA